MPYHELNPDRLIGILDHLQEGLEKYFPDAALGRVMEELKRLAVKAKTENARPRGALYSAILAQLAFVGLIVGFIFWISHRIRGDESVTLVEMFQGLEAAINICIFLGIGVGFLFTLETRIRRKRVLTAIDELRSLAHIIDLHQIRKHPERLPAGAQSSLHSDTLYSPADLVLYLDYASDMLSIVAKLAALYGKNSVDGVVLEGINSVESLTASISQKIWQKISIALSLRQPSDVALP